MSVSKYALVYLLLVLPLQVNPGLDVTSRLLEGLSLGDLGGVVGADPDYISAQEDQHVGAGLSTCLCKEHTRQRGGKNNMSVPPNVQKSQHKAAGNSVWLQSVSNYSIIEDRKTSEGLKIWLWGLRWPCGCSTRGQQEGTFKGFSMFQW